MAGTKPLASSIATGSHLACCAPFPSSHRSWHGWCSLSAGQQCPSIVAALRTVPWLSFWAAPRAEPIRRGKEHPQGLTPAGPPAPPPCRRCVQGKGELAALRAWAEQCRCAEADRLLAKALLHVAVNGMIRQAASWVPVLQCLAAGCMPGSAWLCVRAWPPPPPAHRTKWAQNDGFAAFYVGKCGLLHPAATSASRRISSETAAIRINRLLLRTAPPAAGCLRTCASCTASPWMHASRCRWGAPRLPTRSTAHTRQPVRNFGCSHRPGAAQPRVCSRAVSASARGLPGGGGAAASSQPVPAVGNPCPVPAGHAGARGGWAAQRGAGGGGPRRS